MEELKRAWKEAKQLIILNTRIIEKAQEIEPWLKESETGLTTAVIISYLKSASKEVIDLLTKIAMADQEEN